MDTAERLGLGAAIGAHVVLFVILSYGLLPRDDIPRREAVAVTLTDEIGIRATTTDRPAPAARSLEDDLRSMIPEFSEPLPQPRVEPAPQPRAEPRREPTPQPRPPETRPERRPEPRAATPTPAPTPARTQPQRRPNRMSNITEGIGNTNDTGSSSSQADVSNSDRSNLISRITNAYRPCFDLGSMSGTSAEDIHVRVHLTPSRNGSINPRQVEVVGYRNVGGENRQYQRRMGEIARSAFLNPACSFPSLPGEMYDNGWGDITINMIPG